MKKLYLLIGLLVLGSGCDKNVATTAVVCESQISPGAHESFVVDAVDNNVTTMKHILTFKYVAEGEINLNEFQTTMQQLKQELEEDLLKSEAQIGQKIPGYQVSFKLDTTTLAITRIQNLKDIDFDLMNKLGFYSGYNRELQGLFLDEELKSFK